MSKEIARTQQANDKIFQDMDNVINGETMNKKLAAEGGLTDHAIQNNVPIGLFVEQLYLAAFSRYPSESEKIEILKTMKENMKSEDPEARRQVLEDFTWAMLTGKEFIFNH